MALDVGSIVVLGALRVGSPTCRLTSRITFTFHRVPGIDPFNMVRQPAVCCRPWPAVCQPRCMSMLPWQPRTVAFSHAECRCHCS